MGQNRGSKSGAADWKLTTSHIAVIPDAAKQRSGAMKPRRPWNDDLRIYEGESRT